MSCVCPQVYMLVVRFPKQGRDLVINLFTPAIPNPGSSAAVQAAAGAQPAASGVFDKIISTLRVLNLPNPTEYF
jgi:hypothetical protein